MRRVAMVQLVLFSLLMGHPLMAAEIQVNTPSPAVDTNYSESVDANSGGQLKTEPCSDTSETMIQEDNVCDKSGDVNADGKFNVFDLLAVIDMMGT